MNKHKTPAASGIEGALVIIHISSAPCPRPRGVGAYKARITVGKPARSGLQMAVIGIVSALAGYFIGALFGAQGSE